MHSPPWLLDVIIVGVYFFFVLQVGLLSRGQDKDLKNFALAGRRMPWWAVLASIVAAETSAGTFLGTPAEGFALQNYMYLQLALGTILGRLIVASLFLKPYYRYGVYSIYEFLGIRFGPLTQKAASATFLFTRVLACGARLYIAAVVLAVAWKVFFLGERQDLFHQWLVYAAALLVLTVATTVYTAIGGIRAVIWTDLLQAVLMVGSAMTALVLLWQRLHASFPGTTLGSLLPLRVSSMLSLGFHSQTNLSDNLRAILLQDYTLWAGLLGSTFLTMATHGTDQDMVQRMLTAPDVRRSRYSVVASGLVDIPISFLFLSIGILLFHYYRLLPDSQLPPDANEVFPYFILKEMPSGLRGLLLAGLFAATMGSLSAGLNSLAVSFTRDWWPKIKATSEMDQTRLARYFTTVFALFIYLIASAIAYFVLTHSGSRMIPIALGIFGYTYGSLLGIFLLGMVTRRRGNDRGNLLAMLCGFAAVSCLSGLLGEIATSIFGSPIIFCSQPVISFPWRVLAGSCVTFFIGMCFRSAKNERELISECSTPETLSKG
ncbi:sodium:solute symporter [Candidatus Methylacidithermus pantelleriae]|uniref:Sodium:proline symporter n=1 Tax=Candidatus Methylacidithermus pantelleriae TaxID=2744239 RepID=A0A8J2BGQ4_9BACT|nr:sodium:solute symporter [Candidatus Methylacidithermus pantelleriae]CAF0692390.1 Sodium:proline symporter [Candidatus Methylacidithermus pantelleriae]